MKTTSPITLMAALSFIAPVDADALAALAAVIAATRKEPGCQEYAAHVHTEDPCRVFFYERWQDQAALDGHNASAHLAAFRASVGPKLAKPGELSFWKRLD